MFEKKSIVNSARLKSATLRALLVVVAGLVAACAPCGKNADEAKIAAVAESRAKNVNLDWAFSLENFDVAGDAGALTAKPAAPDFDAASWERVNLPHAVKSESPYAGKNYYKGECWYRKTFDVPADWKNKNVSLYFEGAMQKADVWVNGKFALTHLGGYLPFTLPISKSVTGAPGEKITVALHLDNRANALFPPGKDNVDFTYHGGLYRNVRLVVTDPVHITDAVEADVPAGGGVFVRTEKITGGSAEIFAQTDVRNDGAKSEKISIKHIVLDPAGNEVAASADNAPTGKLAPGKHRTFAGTLEIKNAQLWSPETPALYTLVSTITKNGVLCDAVKTRFGIRTVAATDDGFFLNGKHVMLSGANRHMNYPWLGNAAADNMQYRDLRLIKDAGFNFVRLAHYPQNEAVMDACDELGLIAIVCTPGWQFFANNDSFKSEGKKNIREMVRWHRNHASAMLWEVSLNETYGRDDYYAECAAIAHEEYPGDQMLTCGDTHASKKVSHYEVPYSVWSGFYNRTVHPDSRIKQGLHREYSDYEFGGQRSTTRVPRGADEEKLLRQAWNWQWSLNKNLSWKHTIGQAIWAFNDNLSNFDKLDETGAGLGSQWGAVDYYRLPKPGFYFFQSQRPATPATFAGNADFTGPTVRIANTWTERATPTKVVVYSNCDEVALVLNGKEIARQKPDSGPDTDYGAYRIEADPMYFATNTDTFAATQAGKAKGDKSAKAIFDGGNCKQLTHPPFTFVPVNYAQGELKAIGYIAGKAVAESVSKTPGKPAALRLRAATLGRPLAADGADAIFVYADIVDADGTIVVSENKIPVTFKITAGDARLAMPATSTAEAGIAPTILQAGTRAGDITLTAESANLAAGTLTIKSVAP